MVDAFFRISVVDGALNICRHRAEYPGCSVEDAVRQLKSGPAYQAGYDYDRAIALGKAVGWDAFDLEGVRQRQLRKTLKRLVIRLKPFWARVSHFGRQRVLRVTTEDQRQCLEFAGLIEQPPSSEVISWWDEVGAFFRAASEQRNMEIGREGERRTLDHERKRLSDDGIPREPVWIAVEDNAAGYDVLSFRRKADGTIDDLEIEVKASAYSPTHFVLTRNEWDIAEKRADSYLFHVWNLETDDLIKLSVSKVATHIPSDRGTGKWLKAKIILI